MTDIAFYKTSLLIHGDGTDGSTTIPDSKGHTITLTGTTQISTARTPYTNSSILFASGDKLAVTASTDFLLTTQFTIEFWVYPTASGQYIFGWSGTNYILIDGSNYLQVNMAGVPTATSSALTLNTWNHVAINRDSNNLRVVYLNGINKGSATAPNNHGSNSVNLSVGIYTGGTPTFIGNFADIRITKDYSRYLLDFTPPAVLLPDTQEPGIYTGRKIFISKPSKSTQQPIHIAGI